MRKILSLITALVLCTTFVSATTIYCKMAQDWWKVDNAAVGCHSWGTPGPGTTWPGVRMTPVEGETDLWSIELDTDKVQNVIFTRVSPLGTSLADWGAKTKDLTIPANGDNLFTITTSSESWGDPGCDGEWSVYGGAVEKPKHDYTITVYLPAFCDDIAAYADSVRVMGGFDDWSNGIWMEKKIDEDFNEYWYAEIKDVEEGTEFKLRFGTDADWKVQVQLNGANMANEAFGETTDIVLHYDGEGYGFAACPAPAARKEFVFVAGEAAEANPAMFAITWGKDGSNETVKMTQKGEEALYTANILETVDSVVLVRCASDATEIIWDGEGKNIWNQTANYELCDTMYFESWVEETNLFAIKCDTPQPVETKYYAKNNWNGGEWTWLEMSATNKENIYMLDSVVFGGTGININTKEEDTDAFWFDVDNIVVLVGDYDGPKIKKPTEDTVDSKPIHVASRHLAAEEPQPLKLQVGDTIMLVFNAADTTLQAGIYGRPAPAARKEFVFVAGEAAEANPAMFAITWGKDGSNETVKMTQKGEEALYTANILETVDSVVLVRCASDATEIIWDGEGKNIWNQTANYELCDTMYFESWVEETNLFAIKCDTPQPVETKYYAKNNWNGGEWTWLEMSATNKENIYMLDSVVFGGTGVNINTKEEDTDAFWFDVDHIVVLVGDYDGPKIKKPTEDTVDSKPIHVASHHLAAEEPQPLKLQAGDTIMLFFNAADTTLHAGIYSRPTQPQPEVKYYAKNNWNGATEWTWLEMSATTQENVYMLDSVVFGGTGVNINDKEDDTDALWFAADAITVLDGLDGLPGPIPPEPQRRDTIPYAPARTAAPLEAPQLLAGDTIKLFFNAADSTLKAAIVGRPQPVEHKFYVTGNAALVGEEKAWQPDAIEMVDYTYTFPMLAAGEYQLKVTDGTWEHAWGYDNLSPTVAVEGLYTDVDGNICFNVYTPNDVTVTFAQGYVVVTGDFKNPQPVPTGIKVNVTVPEGTPACYFYGEMSGNTFVEMDKVDDTHYTTTFAEATSIGWGYLFAWEKDNWNTKNAEGDFKVEPVEGVINVEVKAWVTAPGTEYKYTTYTEWQVKFGPAWEWVNMTKQEDGTFTVEAVWGNTGINIASGDNPIKQDWYPLDDAALTVAEDVAEGDNVVISLTVVNDNTVALNVAKKVTTNISNVKGQAGQRYNILGQSVSETYRGIVIMNGQTFLQK